MCNIHNLLTTGTTRVKVQLVNSNGRDTEVKVVGNNVRDRMTLIQKRALIDQTLLQ